MEYGVLEQIQMVFDSRYKIFNWIGSFLIRWFPTMMGSIIPLETFAFAHYGQHIPYYEIPVAGGLIYSALTVFKWMCSALHIRGASKWETRFKVAGFVLLTEAALIMCSGDIMFLSYITLGVLFFVNGVATGSSLMLESKEKKEARENSEMKQKEIIRTEILSEIEREEAKKKEVADMKRREAAAKRARVKAAKQREEKIKTKKSA